MKAILRALLVGILVDLIGSAVAFADAPDPETGTWTLNLAKSRFSPGPAPKSQTRTYARTAQGVTFAIKGVTAGGSPVSYQSTYKYDGKDYPVTGSSIIDTLSVERVNPSTVRFTGKKAGKVVETGTRKVSADGKVLTVSVKGTTAKGVQFREVGIYDRQ